MTCKVSVICYKSKKLSNGDSPVMLRISKDGKRKYVSLGISVNPKQWDFKKNCPMANCSNRESIILLAKMKINETQRLILQKEVEGTAFTPSSLLHSEKSKKTNTVGDYFKSYIKILESEQRSRYASMYRVSFSSFVKFSKTLQIPFTDIDENWMKRYESWMKSQGYAINTIGTRLRHLRVIFNKALDDKVICQEDYPFSHFKVSRIHQNTAKRALCKKDIKRVLSYKGKTDTEQLAIDLFSFSYYMGGINFVDMALLQKSSIIENRLCYIRHKTKKQIVLPIQSQTVNIIMKYYKDENDFLFPILSSRHKSEISKINRLHKVLSKVNKSLRLIGEQLNLPIKLTTYVARHSFATILKKSGVSTSIICETLGHSSEHVTQVYLDSFDNEQINEAMKNLL